MASKKIADITLEKKSGTVLTLQTEKKYVDSDYYVNLGVQSASSAANTASADVSANTTAGLNATNISDMLGEKSSTEPESGYYIRMDATGSGSSKITGAGWIDAGTLPLASASASKYFPVNAGTVTQNKPSVDSSGLVTATASSTAGIIAGGTFNNTLQLSTQSGKTVTPTESEQTAVASGKYTTGNVKVAAISSSYIGSAVTRNDSSDLEVSGATITAPAGYYATDASASVASGTAGTPVATKGTVSNHSISVSPSVSNTTGYITGGTKTGTAVTVSASELVSGTKTISASGSTDVTNYKYASVAAGAASTPATSITANPSISVNASGLITATTSATKDITPDVTEGYIIEGTEGTVTVSGSATSQLTTQAGSTIAPTESVQTAVAKGKYTTGDVKIGAISTTYVGSGIARNDSDDLTASGATVTAPAGYYAEDATKTIDNGTVVASVSSNTGGSASMSATGFTASSSSTSYYVTLATSAGSVKAKAAGGTAGYVTSSTTNETAATSVAVSGNGNKLYIPTAGITASVSSNTAGAATMAATGMEPLTSGTSDYYVTLSTTPGSVKARGVGTKTGIITSSTSNETSATSVTVNGNNTKMYIPEATFANSATSGTTYTDKSSDAPVLISGDYLYINKGYTPDIKISLAKLVPDGSDVKGHGEYIISGHSAYDDDGVLVAGTIPTLVASDITVNGKTVTVPLGKYTGASGGTAVSTSVADGDYSASVTDASISSAPTYTPATSGTITDVATTTKPSGTDGTDYWTITPSGTKTNGNARSKATATISKAGYIPAGSKTTSSYTNKTITITENAGTTTYIPKAVIAGSSTNATATTTVAPGTVSISKQSTPTGVVNAASGNATTTAPSSGVYVAVKATAAANSTGTTSSISGSGTATVGTAGYAPSSLTGSISVSGTATAKTSAKDSDMTYVPITTTSASVSGKTVSYGSGWITEGSKSVADVVGSIGGSATAGSATAAIDNVNSMVTITDLSGKTAGTDYWQVKATATGTKGGYTPKYTVTSAGWLNSTVTGTKQDVSVTGDTTGKSIYIPKATASASNGTATATAGTATTSVSGMVTTTTNTGYSVSASATGGNASVTASSVTIGAGYNPTSVTASTAAASNTGANASNTKYIQKGILSAAVSSNTSGSASMAATGFTPLASGTSAYYVTQTTTAGSVKAKASVGTEGYVKSETAETSATSVAVSGNNTKLYIPAGGYAGSVSSHSITTTPVVTGATSGTITSISSTTVPSGTDGTDYWTITPGGSVTTTGVSTAKGKATISAAGYIPAGNNESAANTVNITPTVNNGSARYISKATTSKTDATVSYTASAGTASIAKQPSASATVTPTGIDGGYYTDSTTSSYYIDCSASAASGYSTATGGSARAQISASSATVSAGYNPSAVTTSTTAKDTGAKTGNTATSTEVTASANQKVYLKAAGISWTGGGLSNTTNYTGTPTVSVGINSQTTDGIGITDTAQTEGYYVELVGSTAKMTGTTKVTRADYKETRTAGYLPARGSTTILASTTSSPTVTVNAASKTRYLTLPTATFAKDGAKVYCSAGGWVPTGSTSAPVQTIGNGTVVASVSSNSGGSASMAATGFTPLSGSSTSSYYVTLSTSTGSVKAKAAGGTAGYITSSTTNETAATSVAVSGNGTKLYIPTTGVTASVSNNTAGSASMAATGFTPLSGSSTSSYYVTLSTSAGSVKAKAVGNGTGIVTSSTSNETAATSVSVSGNGNKVYIPTTGVTASVSSNSGGAASMAATGMTPLTSGTSSYYVTLSTSAGSVKAKAVGNGTGMITSSTTNETGATSVSVSGNGTKMYIPEATLANTATSGITYTDKSSDAPVLVSGGYLFINKGYIPDIKISLAKLVPDGSDVKGHGEYILLNHSAYDNDGTLVAGTIPTLVQSDLVVSGNTVTVPVGKYTGASGATAISTSIAAGTVKATVSSNSGGSASMAPTGFTAASSATSYYVTLSTSAGSVKAKAAGDTAGYVTSSTTNETAATSVAVSGNGTKLYIPTTGVTASVSSNTGGSASMAATGFTAASSATSYYVTLTTSAGSVKAKAVGNGTGIVTSSTTNETAATSVSVSGNGNKVYIPTTGVTASVSSNTAGSASMTATGFTPLSSGTSAYYVTLSTSAGSVKAKAMGNGTGIVTSSTSNETAATSVAVSGNGNKVYIPAATPAFTGGGVSKSASVAGSGATLNDTNNGISVTATATASRAAVTYNGAVDGYVKISSGTTASAAVGNSSTTAIKYIAGVTLAKGTANRTFTVTAPDANNTNHTYLFTTDTTGRTTIKVDNTLTMEWNATTESLDFVYT